jgi:hypothetical protein
MRSTLTLLAVLSVVLGIGYIYYKDTQATISTLLENTAVLNEAVKTQQNTIETLQEDYAKSRAETARLNTAYADIRRQNSLLANRLDPDRLTTLALERPELIERLINSGTVSAARCFELLSGSPLTPSERNATSENAFNSECPWLWPGNSAVGVRQ